MVHRRSVVHPPISKIFSVKAKFNMEPQWDGGTKVCLRGLGHMTKIAATPIYGKNPSKNLLLQNKRANDLVAWYVAWGLGHKIVCSNDDPKLILTYFTPRSNLVSYAFIWGKLLESLLMQETYSKWPEWQKFYVYITILTIRGLSAPCPGAIYMYKKMKNYV